MAAPLGFLLAALSLPPEVRGVGGGEPAAAVCRAESDRRSSLWARARPAEVERFCATLARGLARLERSPAEALVLAREAIAIAPRETLGPVLEGRALLRLGRATEAWQKFSPGRPRARRRPSTTPRRSTTSRAQRCSPARSTTRSACIGY